MKIEITLIIVAVIMMIWLFSYGILAFARTLMEIAGTY